jgi:FAD:protein FMN transferase
MTKTFTFKAMGSQVFIALDTDDPGIVEQAFIARKWFEEWEQSLSRFRISSELSELNRQPGKPFFVSPILFQVTKIAVEANNNTGGLINPLILNSLLSAGYTNDFESLISRTDFDLRNSIDDINVEQTILINETERTITIPKGTQIDLGGVAKGWAAQQTMMRLKEHCPVIVDAGGDIAISGPLSNGEAWPIGVANPFNKDQNLELLMLSSGGVATSGRDYRKWLLNGKLQHHIIDPRIKGPAQTDILTSTIISSNVIDAEISAKVAVILGSKASATWFEDKLSIEYLFVLEDGTIQKSRQFEDYEWKNSWQRIKTSQ